MDQKNSLRALCGWSLGFYLSTYAPYLLLLFYFAAIKFDMDKANPVLVIILMLVSCALAWGFQITAWVLMIIARVKDSKYKFALVLMWVYIGILIFNLVSYVISVALSVTVGAFATPVFFRLLDQFSG